MTNKRLKAAICSVILAYSLLWVGPVLASRSFNGSTDKAITTGRVTKFEFTTAFSVAFWLYWTPSGSGNNTWVAYDKWGAGSDNGWYVGSDGSSNAQFYLYNHSAYCFVSFSSFSVSTSNWNFIGATWNGSSTVSMYVSGGRAQSTTCGSYAMSYNTTASATGLTLMHPNGGSRSATNGALADLVIWNVELSQAEVNAMACDAATISTLHGCTPPNKTRPQSIVAFYPLWGNNSPEDDFATSPATLNLTGTSVFRHASGQPFPQVGN